MQLIHRTYSARSLKSLTGTHPDMQRVAARCLREGPLDFVVIEGLRSEERQQGLVDSGISPTMNSRHRTGHAIDVMVLEPASGKGTWSWPLYVKLAEAMKAAAKAEGVAIVWGGDWASRDGPHFELDRKAYPAGGIGWAPRVEPPKDRTNSMQSGTVRATGTQMVTGGGLIITAITQTEGIAQYLLIGFAGVFMLSALWIMRARLHKWAAGDR